MGHHFAVLIQIFIFTAIAGTYLFFRPTRILLTADSLVIHSAHKDDVALDGPSHWPVNFLAQLLERL